MKTLWINWYTREIWRKMEAEEKTNKGKCRELDVLTCGRAMLIITCGSLLCTGKLSGAGGAQPAARPVLWWEKAEPHGQHLQCCYCSAAERVVRGETYQVS